MTINMMSEQKSDTQDGSKKLIIPKKDIYVVGTRSFFKFEGVLSDEGHKTIYRDVFIDLSKNCVLVLRGLCKVIGIPNSKSIKKAGLIKILTPLIIFESV